MGLGRPRRDSRGSVRSIPASVTRPKPCCPATTMGSRLSSRKTIVVSPVGSRCATASRSDPPAAPATWEAFRSGWCAAVECRARSRPECWWSTNRRGLHNDHEVAASADPFAQGRTALGPHLRRIGWPATARPDHRLAHVQAVPSVRQIFGADDEDDAAPFVLGHQLVIGLEKETHVPDDGHGEIDRIHHIRRRNLHRRQRTVCGIIHDFHAPIRLDGRRIRHSRIKPDVLFPARGEPREPFDNDLVAIAVKMRPLTAHALCLLGLVGQ